jgi:hypothetical protein
LKQKQQCKVVVEAKDMKRRGILAAGVLLLAAGFVMPRLMQAKRMDAEDFGARYFDPLPAPTAALSVYHLGHSLVGRDMPVMLDQLAHAAGYDGHRHASQLGWGASLNQHRQGPTEVPGFDSENAHPNHAPAAGLSQGGYDAVVLTEMVEIRDAIRYQDSAAALAFWAREVRAGNPAARLYLYETWHRLDDAEGWLNRIDADLTRAWQDELMRVAMADPKVGTIYLIPGGQVLAAAARAIETGQVPGLTRREDLFSQDPAGAVDPIHLNDLGAYLIALTHFSVLYHQSPEGLPAALLRADGQAALSLPPQAVAPLQRLVWQVVSGNVLTGVAV